MPQLAPLNWLFLFMLFWGFLFLISIFVWWGNVHIYSFINLGKMKVVTLKSKWKW
uniref:ATP synthase F0 subunit 8 n=1 Tax=Hemiarthrum setulosum TaxID=1437515 RepID=A0A6H1PGA4_9MOLL|nr:ATP synthase F0 subunit 8 [Hemiarthrum setulosum]